MTKHPLITLGGWIILAGTDCVVISVFKPDSHSGVYKVVFNKSKPTTHDVDWDVSTPK